MEHLSRVVVGVWAIMNITSPTKNYEWRDWCLELAVNSRTKISKAFFHDTPLQ